MNKQKILALLNQLEDALAEDEIYGYEWFFVKLKKELEAKTK